MVGPCGLEPRTSTVPKGREDFHPMTRTTAAESEMLGCAAKTKFLQVKLPGKKFMRMPSASNERVKIKCPRLQKPKTGAPDNSKSFKARATVTLPIQREGCVTRPCHNPPQLNRASWKRPKERCHLPFNPSRQAITSSSPRTASSTRTTGCTWNTNAGSIEQNL